jgi:hypothetical protein
LPHLVRRNILLHAKTIKRSATSWPALLSAPQKL